MTGKHGGEKGGFTYSSVEPQPEPKPRRAWLLPNWKRPGPPPKRDIVRFAPDYHADLPLWGVSWQNPPLSRDLLQALCDWQDEFDDHGIERWPDDEWDRWFARGKDLAIRVIHELGPSVTLNVEFFDQLDA
jgi:hypothetical protein